MAKLDALQEVQIGTEATDAWGTAVNPTVKLMGVEELSIQPVYNAEMEEELRGTLQPGYRSHVRAVHGEASMSGLLEIDDFPYLMANLANCAATTDAAGNFTWSVSAPSEDSDGEDVLPLTICKTDRTDSYSLHGAVLSALTIEGEAGGPITYDAEFWGQQVATDVHAALSDRVTLAAMGHMGQLYIDPGSDSVGQTEIANQAYNFSLALETDRKQLRHIGNLTPSGYREGKWSGSLSLSIEASTDSFPYLDDILGSTNASPEKNVRLKFTAATDSIVTLDFAGVLNEAPELYSDEDNVITIDFELTGQKNEGMASFFIAEVYSTLSALL
jgi:hypothetical protein